jgi:Ran GTPase-activating protein (RanGAP) involved in mRNA processing and transport
MNRELVIQKKSFSKNIFKDLMSKKWDQWHSLTRLNLSSNNINGEMLYYMTNNDKRFPNLVSLDLSDNNIEDEGMKSLTKNVNAFPNLEELVLSKFKLQLKIIIKLELMASNI